MAKNKYTGKEHKVWRKIILETYDNKCIVCGSTHYLSAHHLISAHYTPLKYHPKNGIPLCGKHHTKYGKGLTPHNENSMVFFIWLTDNHPECIEFVKQHGTNSIR